MSKFVIMYRFYKIITVYVYIVPLMFFFQSAIVKKLLNCFKKGDMRWNMQLTFTFHVMFWEVFLCGINNKALKPCEHFCLCLQTPFNLFSFKISFLSFLHLLHLFAPFCKYNSVLVYQITKFLKLLVYVRAVLRIFLNKTFDYEIWSSGCKGR